MLDRRGAPVPSLTADDFELQEDGLPQAIQSFKFVEANGRPDPGDDVSLPIRSPEHAAAEASRDDVRVFLVFWDEYHIDRFASAIRAREALAKFVSTAFGPKDLVALMDPLTPVDAIRFTRDRAQLVETIHKLQGRLGVFTPPRSVAEEAQLAHGSNIARLRAEVSVSALKAAAVYLGTLREGRKAIVFVSQGPRALGRDTGPLLADVVRAANECNTAIYTLDPRGLGMSQSSDTLLQIAENTGAKAIVNTNGLVERLVQIVRDASAFYLLGYTSARNPEDGRFHQIKVRVKRPGLEVRARRGYWAPSARAIEHARADAAAAELPRDVSTALSVLSPSTARRTVDVWTGVRKSSDGQLTLSVAWTPRTGQSDSRERPASIWLTSHGMDGITNFEGRVNDAGLSFPIAPGTWKLQISVRNAADEIIDSETRVIDVPDLASHPLAFGSAVVLRARTTQELRALNDDLDAAPYAGHEFYRTDRLLIRFNLYGDPNARVSASLTNRRRTALAPLRVAPISGRPGSYQVDLPLSIAAPGEYLIAIAAEDGWHRAETLVAIRVIGGG